MWYGVNGGILLFFKSVDCLVCYFCTTLESKHICKHVTCGWEVGSGNLIRWYVKLTFWCSARFDSIISVPKAAQTIYKLIKEIKKNMSYSHVFLIFNVLKFSNLYNQAFGSLIRKQDQKY